MTNALDRFFRARLLRNEQASNAKRHVSGQLNTVEIYLSNATLLGTYWH